MEKSKIILPWTIHVPRKRAKKLNLLTKEQMTMLKKEYKIYLPLKSTEADALKVLRKLKWTRQVEEPIVM